MPKGETLRETAAEVSPFLLHGRASRRKPDVFQVAGILSRSPSGAKAMLPFHRESMDSQRFHAVAVKGGSPRRLCRKRGEARGWDADPDSFHRSISFHGTKEVTPVLHGTNSRGVEVPVVRQSPPTPLPKGRGVK